MFAARLNQENAIHQQQTAAAAKPLNQGVKGLAPKTPAKTPFRGAQNDENIVFRGGKTGQGKQNVLFGEDKGGKVDKSAFVTPAGPRNRAPLGNKTANVKATAFKTPAPPTQDKPSAKHTSPRLRRAKIKVHEAEPLGVEENAEEREIEYMPPRAVPLPDYPDDWPLDQFEGKDLTQGWWSKQESDEDDEFSDFEQKLQEAEARERKQQQVKKVSAVKTSNMQKTTRDPLTAKPPQTLKSRSAASALSNPTKTTTAVPSFAAPTAAVKARMPSVLASKKPTSTVGAAGNTRHTAARVASNSTLGYSRGRAVSARKPLSVLKDEEVPALEFNVSEAHGHCTALDDLFDDARESTVDDDEDDDVEGIGGVRLTGLEEEEDEMETFQLPAVEL